MNHHAIQIASEPARLRDRKNSTWVHPTGITPGDSPSWSDSDLDHRCDRAQPENISHQNLPPSFCPKHPHTQLHTVTYMRSLTYHRLHAPQLSGIFQVVGSGFLGLSPPKDLAHLRSLKRFNNLQESLLP